MNTEQKVMELLQELSGSDGFSPKDSLQEDVGLDSLAMVTLLMMLEDTFEIELKQSDMNPLALIRVEDITKLVEKYLENCDGASEESVISSPENTSEVPSNGHTASSAGSDQA